MLDIWVSLLFLLLALAIAQSETLEDIQQTHSPLLLW